MTVKERMISIRLSEHICRQTEYAKKIGITIDPQINGKDRMEDKNEVH